MPATVFISYSRKDIKWRQQFEKAIGNGVYKKKFKLWYDEQIAPNDAWKKKIRSALGRAEIALLLVDNDFLNSDYITNTELPILHKRREKGYLKILWVPIQAVKKNILELSGLDEVMSVWSGRPLSTLRDQALKDAFMKIASEVVNAVGLDDSADEIRQKIEDKIPAETKLGEPFAAGDYSIFYRAKQEDGAEVAVKVLVPPPNKTWLSADFVKRAKIVQNIENSTSIRVLYVVEDKWLPCVVMQFSNAPTLKSRLDKEGKLSGQLVANAIGQLARLAGDLHRMSGQPLIGPARPSHVHYNGEKNKALVSSLPIANETLNSCRNASTRLQDADALTYLSPERYYGKPIGERTDQYYLASLALELLQGRPPVTVETFAGLKLKEEFFASPISKFEEALRRQQPALSFVLAKMLEREPENRWPTMKDVVQALQDIANGDVPDAVREHADNQYTNVLQRNPDFFRSFYRILFKKSDAIEALFAHKSIEEQSQKLNEAMNTILNYTEGLKASSLTGEVRRHNSMGIKPEFFEWFRDAFLEALREAGITDCYSEDAWRAVLDPALNYMKSNVALPAS